jgi:hypothetical protein
MKNIHVLQTAQPSRLFYFNNELRLEHNTVERRQTRTSTSLLMKKLKKRLFHRKRKVYFQRKFLTSIRYFYTKKESKII